MGVDAPLNFPTTSDPCSSLIKYDQNLGWTGEESYSFTGACNSDEKWGLDMNESEFADMVHDWHGALGLD
eukprot:CAMPEP_0181311700 /NCGR_PEP_ID=MMETSP1101-20121128/13289_1 /TAXON_ID=46948 /ORGANISM="Rhodomonas abbreviata, Strain Caron Lab Isolate" /LENGTH=69 /DNA_ID=CAMNT_0023418473 /DNA_START=11 /DNA_END=220 /DNA_ORIENTATION=-